MTSVDIVLDYYLWKKKIKNPKIYIRKNLLKLNKLKLFQNKSKNCTIFLTNNKKMKELNKKFRKKNITTDVLSFPLNNKERFKKNIYLGDIAVNYEIIKKRSKNSNFFLEFDKMWIHGYLHLLGHDHKKDKDYKKNAKIREINIKYFL